MPRVSCDHLKHHTVLCRLTACWFREKTGLKSHTFYTTLQLRRALLPWPCYVWKETANSSLHAAQRRTQQEAALCQPGSTLTTGQTCRHPDHRPFASTAVKTECLPFELSGLCPLLRQPQQFSWLTPRSSPDTQVLQRPLSPTNTKPRSHPVYTNYLQIYQQENLLKETRVLKQFSKSAWLKYLHMVMRRALPR